ncbi:MAG: hypothetical protein Q9160_007376 [Pyrenula sp. 1 TL-2023]
MSISRLTASLASASNELTVAAAALNFDFSLVRIDAPDEFKLIGPSLSANRRADAEGGKAHVTARKLGALFDRIIPPIPNLIKAYGHRASEISSTPAANPQASNQAGIFAAHVGADGTTLWAAATSGRSAIAVHLLACLLARIWTGPEATSLWAEIVERRRQEVAASFEREEEVDFPTLSVVRQDFSRTQLAEWDASARGWLRAADIAKDSELKQLMLILKNIDTTVDRAPDPYEGVIRVWRKTLTTLECLVSGMPQRVSDGSVLMAIWAWHVYPDLILVKGANVDVRFKDPLISSGGCLTIGLQMEDEAKGFDGVHWSLSLANLRYYGDPVVSHRAVVPDGSRLSFAELAQVVLGSIISQWTGYENSLVTAAEFFLALWDAICYGATSNEGMDMSEQERQSAQMFLDIEYNWMRILVDAARPVVESAGLEHQTAQQLIKLGQRRGSNFFCTKIPSFFGLLNVRTLISLSSSTEAWIKLLREVAAEVMTTRSDTSIPAIIRYASGAGRVFEYASVFPDLRTSNKRKRKGSSRSPSNLKRWISSKSAESLAKKGSKGTGYAEQAPYTRSKSHPTVRTTESHSRRPRKVTTMNVECWDSRRVQIEGLGEEVLSREEAGVSSIDEACLKVDSQSDHFVCMMGDQAVAALFIPQSYQAYYASRFRNVERQNIKTRHATEMLRSRSMHVGRLISCLNGGAEVDEGEEAHSFSSTHRQLRRTSSLRAFSSAARVYKLLSKATISPKLLSRPFNSGLWIPKGLKKLENQDLSFLQGDHLSRPQSFSCIALLESGIHNIDPSLLCNVIALSSSDSIYVAALLLCDSWETPLDDEIRRISGNIGRAGLAMLFAPENVRLCPRDDTRWRLVNHTDFDGAPGDSFRGTSLHLSFTGYERPLDTDSSGAQDVDVYLLETRISIHDNGAWIGDLNVMQSLGSEFLSKLTYPALCSHSTTSKPIAWSMTAIDNWDELFDAPKTACIIRAHRNWIARLAFICICHQLRRRTVVLPGHGGHPNKFIDLWRDGGSDHPTYIW